MDRQQEIMVGRLGSRCFPAGLYAYVGSAMGDLESRIARHIGRSKKLHWHIDHLLEAAVVEEVIYAESVTWTECIIAHQLTRDLISVPRFGCSDCSCPSHLFFSTEREELWKVSAEAFCYTGLSPLYWSDRHAYVEGGCR